MTLARPGRAPHTAQPLTLLLIPQPNPPPAVEDLLSHLGFGLEPFLPALTAIALKLLAAATAPLEGAAGGAAAERDEVGLAVQAEVEEEEEEPQATTGRGTKRREAGQAAGAPAQADGHVAGAALPNGALGSSESGSDEEGGEGAMAAGQAEGGEVEAAAALTPEERAAAAAAAAAERHREVRGAALRLLARLWLRFPATREADWNEAWGPLLAAVQPLVPRLAAEASSSRWGRGGRGGEVAS